MTEDEWLASAGLHVTPELLDRVRSLLKTETEREETSQGAGDTALMRLCVAQLFIGGFQEDIAAIWRARQASQDAAGSIDIQMLCIGGVAGAIAICADEGMVEARKAIEDSVRSGDLGDFSVKEYIKFLEEYYRGYDTDSPQ
jgi:hypothetical protein